MFALCLKTKPMPQSVSADAALVPLILYRPSVVAASKPACVTPVSCAPRTTHHGAVLGVEEKGYVTNRRGYGKIYVGADATGMSLMFKDSSDTDIGHFYVQFSSGSLTWVNDITSQQIPIQ